MIFHVLLEEAEDGWIVAECPALAGCVSQGRDEQEALANIQEAISVWLWAEDQKAITNLPKNLSRPPMMVMVWFMGRLNNISGKEAVAAFLKAGID